ncbi:UDP-2,3-diacylglucosamine pyrophosphatase LpxH [Luteibacter rhizovicinus]|uniref:UDP-2,3-diacylglucosamine pyrophosphatase LpxH n=1 Tax=Luteibacter rhizovicinus TaxID=242606 RepID=A0A4R3YJR0_9GAMM|nr:UDP-2,3-diacylglucosamine diphosphatase [Luteibacter rhizovicinus]TCV92322.1 UDP-2,3-diacylglucosamine pyrophosphatase LpxH [Luteibacter rhizovicinus]
MAKLTCRTAFISDVHLGTPDCKADFLLDFLKHLDCEKLYLVGDIVDMEAMARRRGWQREHSAVVGHILDMAAHGVEVIYIPGNHDAPMRGMAGQMLAGIRVELDAVHEGADGRRYRVSHGDEFDPEHVGRTWMLYLGDALHRAICWANRRVHAVRRRMDLPYLPLSIIIKSHIGKALDYIHGYEERVARDARERGFDGHICGHIHFGHVRTIDGIVYLNDGDWVEHCTALVEDATGAMELLHWTGQATPLGRASREMVLPSLAGALAFAPLADCRTDLSGLETGTARAA